MAHRRWIVADADKEKASLLSEKLNIDPFIAFLLVSRGMDDELSASDFLSSSYAFTSPYSFADMDKAVSRINEAIDCSQNICIYGDYDCDGVTSTALLYTFLESMGASVSYFIPNRLSDGYGMNKSAIDIIKKRNTDLIITVDNGISAFEEADYINQLGMDLIITDHHQIGEALPNAVAVINPHREDNKIRFRDFAGVGVAFKLACAVYDGDVDDMLEQYADLVAIGTIGDIVPLKSENRGFVKAGLKLINSDARIGLSALRQVSGNSDDDLTAVDIAFQICPRINAAGRMDTAYKALELLICDDYEDAQFKAEQLNLENNHRHEVESNIADDISEKIALNPSLIQQRVIVIDGNNYHHGVIGIAASHVVTRYGKPAIIIGIDDDGECVGSARSVDGFNIFDAISSCSSMLTHFGGHPLAAGLGIRANDIDAFRQRINQYANNYYPVMPNQTLGIDCKLSPFYLNTDLVDNLNVLEPFGADNPQPVFGLFNVKLMNITPMGDGKHIRLDVQKKGQSFKAVKFQTTPQEFPYNIGDDIDLAVKLSKNYFKGKYYLSIRVIDVRYNGVDDDKYFAERDNYEAFLLGNEPKGELYPTRDICAAVYRHIRSNSQKNFTVEDLYFSLKQKYTFGQVSFAAEAFLQSGLVNINQGRIAVNEIQGKTDLNNTKIITTLKGRLKVE